MTTGALATIKTAGADATMTLLGLVIFKDRELAPAGVLAPMTTTTDVKLTMEQEAAGVCVPWEEITVASHPVGRGMKLEPETVMMPPTYAVGGTMPLMVGELMMESFASLLLVPFAEVGLFIKI